MAKGRIFFDFMLLACAAWAFSSGNKLPEAYTAGEIGPGFFPTVVAGLGILIVSGILWEDIKAARQSNAPDIKSIDLKTALGAVAIFAVLVLYIIMVQSFGFLLSTMPFLFIAMMICNVILESDGGKTFFDLRFGVTAAIASILSTFVTYAVFSYGFGLNLS